MPLEIRRLNTCTFDQALRTWDEGFSDYAVDVTLSLDGFLSRLAAEAISPEYSFMAFQDDRPVGFLLNAIGFIGGRNVAWNGGTAVIPEFRSRGVAAALMEATIELYRELGVETATLEAISGNTKAIALYRRFGYQVIDELVFLRHQTALDPRAFEVKSSGEYSVREVSPEAVAQLGFYQHTAPWQSQSTVRSRKGAGALIVLDREGKEVGYALYQRTFDDQGLLVRLVLCQCGVNGRHSDTRAIVATALQTVYAPLAFQCTRTTHNLSTSNKALIELLLKLGFEPFVEQVQMTRSI
jgi:ribosomal protein S18 acetylase RimI-like enzyme